MTLRAVRGLPSLRSARVFAAARAAIAAGSGANFRIIHFSVQDDHVHLIVEAQDKRALWQGVGGLRIRAARALNGAMDRAGRVWNGKYHARALRTPRETRTALVYVLQNWKKHIRGAQGVDGRSSGPWFGGWAWTPPSPAAPTPVVPPQTWLAARGWRDRGGGALRNDELPAPSTPSARRRESIPFARAHRK